jgi:putative phage-type endonuclease
MEPNVRSTKVVDCGSSVPVRPWGIGGSDIGAILGLSPYRGPVDVWAEKVGGSGGQGGGSGSEAIHLRYGQHLEPFVAREYERMTGHVTHEHPRTLRHPKHPHLFAHVDRLVGREGRAVVDSGGNICTPTLLECKTASAFSADQWGQAWTDQVPHAYLVQCVWYTTITGCEEAHLAVLLGNSEFRVYRVGHDRGLGERLVNAALCFWDEHVMTGIPPQPTTRAEVLKLYPLEVAGLEVEADDEAIRQLRRLRRIQGLNKRLEQSSEHIKQRLTALIRDAERLCSNGSTLATWRSCAPSHRVDVARLRRERPDIAGEYLIESAPSRRLVLGGASDA